MADVSPDTATYQDKSDIGEKPADLVKLWLSAIALSGKGEEAWRKKADETEALYHAEAERAKTSQKVSQFNILYTNTETLIPALYNSTPTPDCRRRFGDADEVGKLVAQITERSIAVTVDQHDFDALMLAAVQDSEVPGRAATRIRYMPRMGPDGRLADQRIEFEHVEWKALRIGPAKRWEMMPWVAFEHYLTREQLIEINPEIGGTIKLDSSVEGAEKQYKADGEGHPTPEVFKRAHVWEVWDKESRKVYFICTSYKDAPLRVEDDPLKLEGFFPIPRPLYGFQKSGTLIPTCPYSLYESQANELEDITRRLKRLVKVLRWRGIAASEVMGSFESLKNLDDGELAPSSEAIHWTDKGLDKAIWMMPIDKLITTIKELYLAREQVKATIFEITGVADIMRGDTDPNETLGAQKIKAQWGSLRLNRRQQEVARYARDLFRLIAEIVASEFSWQTISLMTGIKLPSQAEKQQAQALLQRAQAGDSQAQAMVQQAPPELAKHLQQPSQEEVEQVLRRDLLREFRVDIESDSTVRADMERTQQNVANFVTGLGQFFSGIGPAVEGGYLPPDTAAALLTGFARNFKLGKQAEDALDRLQEQAKEAAQQPKPDPEMQKVEAEAKAREAELAMKAKDSEQTLAFKRQEHDQKMVFEQQKHQDTMALEREKVQQQAMLAQQQGEMQMAMDARKADADMAFKREQADGQNRTKMAIEGMRADHAVVNEGVTGQTKQIVDNAVGALSEGIGQGLTALAQALQQLAESQNRLASIMSAPRRVTRDKATGRADGVEIVMPTIQ